MGETTSFQSLSGFLMVATRRHGAADQRQHRVSIPIGFSNGCNRWRASVHLRLPVMFQSLSGFLMVATHFVERRRGDRGDVSIPIGFSNGCNTEDADGQVVKTWFQSLSGFLMVATEKSRSLPPIRCVSIPIGFSNGCNKLTKLT